MISFGMKHCKYGMHIYVHAFVQGTAFKSFMDDKLHKVVVRTIGTLYVSINHYPQHVLCFYIVSYLCVMHLFSPEEANYFCFKKAVLILILHHLFILMFMYI